MTIKSHVHILNSTCQISFVEPSYPIELGMNQKRRASGGSLAGWVHMLIRSKWWVTFMGKKNGVIAFSSEAVLASVHEHCSLTIWSTWKLAASAGASPGVEELRSGAPTHTGTRHAQVHTPALTPNCSCLV